MHDRVMFNISVHEVKSSHSACHCLLYFTYHCIILYTPSYALLTSQWPKPSCFVMHFFKMSLADTLTCPLGFKAIIGSALFTCFVEANVRYIL